MTLQKEKMTAIEKMFAKDESLKHELTNGKLELTPIICDAKCDNKASFKCTNCLLYLCLTCAQRKLYKCNCTKQRKVLIDLDDDDKW